MFKKTILSIMTVAAIATAASAVTATTASAGGFGFHIRGHHHHHHNHYNNRIIVRSNYGSQHVAWCYSNYRSYRDYDNTFQPFNGPRKLCISPFFRG